MNEIEKLTTEVRRATDYQANKKFLREKIQTDLHMACNGGLFKITAELYAFVTCWKGDPDAFFLEDVYGNPIKVDPAAFLEMATEHYQRVMNTWHQQYAELRRIRRV
jgi:hypothetical protein